MKKYSVIIFLLAIFFVSCNEDKSVDPTVMPEETATGAQTFGCLVDGALYVGGRYSDEYHSLISDNHRTSINFTYNQSNTMDVKVKVEENGYIAFTINVLAGEFTNAKFLQSYSATEGKDLGSGKVVITRFDSVEAIISGRFYSGNSNGDGLITFGRFDVKYK